MQPRLRTRQHSTIWSSSRGHRDRRQGLLQHERPKGVIAEIVNNGSNYYSLAYTTTNKKWDGQFRTSKSSSTGPV